jgi:2,3-bisphosphoglycerate-dependent phosphoglycerate mutase
MEILKIYLFRHGQTYFNKNGIFTGWKDSHLTPLGIKQAKIIAKKLKNKQFQVAFYTKLNRSKTTLKEVLKFHPECLRLIKDDRMIERRYGKLEGTSHKKFIENFGKKDLTYLEKAGDALENLSLKDKKKLEKLLGESEYEAIHRGYDIPPPGGESFAMVEKRVKNFIDYLVKFMKKNKVNVAISAHGNSIRLFRKIMENTTREECTRWIIPFDRYFEYSIPVK